VLPDLASELAVGAMSLDVVLALVFVSDMDDLVPVLVLVTPALPAVPLVALARLTFVPNDDTRERLLAAVLDVPAIDPFLLPTLELVARELAVPTEEPPALELAAEPVLLAVVDPKAGIGDLDLVLDAATDRGGLTEPATEGWSERETAGARDDVLLFKVETGNFFDGGPILPSFLGSATTIGVGLDVGIADVEALEAPTPFNTFWTIDFAEDRNPNRDAIPLGFAMESKTNINIRRGKK
jgi:hypothetical protein